MTTMTNTTMMKENITLCTQPVLRYQTWNYRSHSSPMRNCKSEKKPELSCPTYWGLIHSLALWITRVIALSIKGTPFVVLGIEVDDNTRRTDRLVGILSKLRTRNWEDADPNELEQIHRSWVIFRYYFFFILLHSSIIFCVMGKYDGKSKGRLRPWLIMVVH